MKTIVRLTLVAAFLPTLTLAVHAAPWQEKVGPGVRSELTGGKLARVIVSLELPPTDHRRLQTLKANVATTQDAVLSRMAPGEWTPTRRFQAVAALAGEVTEAGLERLAAMPEVKRIDLDVGGSGNLSQGVPLTHTDDVHALGLTGNGVTVAVLDSGIDTNHGDLQGDLVAEACFCFDNGAGCCPGGGTTQFGAGAAEDDNGHGSNVTGIVTSDGTIAPIGTAPDAGIVAVKVLDNNNSFCCASDVVAGLDWIINNRPDVDVVNMSLGTFAMFSGDCDLATSYTQALAGAINTLRTNGVLSFVSSGNRCSTTQMEAPACIARAVSVGAVWDSNVGTQSIFCCTDITTAADKPTCFSNRNDRTDLFAPGAPITSCFNNGGTSTYYGTSQAAPHIAGCAADILEEFPGLDPTLLETTLETTGVTINDSGGTGLMYPRVDCLAALDNLACRDLDSDGFYISGLCSLGGTVDCNDQNATQFPGNPEICDGLDNDCDGMVPAGETTPPDRIQNVVLDGATMQWDTDPVAMTYDVIRGDLTLLRSSGGDFAVATTGCEQEDVVGSSIAPPDPPAGTGWWFLVRGSGCPTIHGSYDSDGAQQVDPRDAEVASSGVDCL